MVPGEKQPGLDRQGNLQQNLQGYGGATFDRAVSDFYLTLFYLTCYCVHGFEGWVQGPGPDAQLVM